VWNRPGNVPDSHFDDAGTRVTLEVPIDSICDIAKEVVRLQLFEKRIRMDHGSNLLSGSGRLPVSENGMSSCVLLLSGSAALLTRGLNIAFFNKSFKPREVAL
jgi:hypothetical protein